MRKKRKIDLDGDGKYTGHDWHLLVDAIEEFNKRKDVKQLEVLGGDGGGAEADLMDAPESDGDAEGSGWSLWGFISDIFEALFSIMFGVFT